MYSIWFERSFPSKYAPLLEGTAVVLGEGTATPEAPLVALPEAHAIIAAARIRYDGAVMDQAPNLLVISRTGIGFDNISIPDATTRGIAVCNAPQAPTVSTAEHAITLMLAVAKQLESLRRKVLAGGTDDFFPLCTNLEVDGRCLGLVGLGRIGSHVAKVARALGMRVVAFDPFIAPERARELGVEQSPTLEALLESADIVSLHLPLSAETHNLMNAERLAQMKRGAILINAARGGLVDEAALLASLENGHLSGAGLDVFQVEPPSPDNPLLQRDDVIATPHIAGATGAGKDRLWRTGITQALQVLRGEKPSHLLNPEVWESTQ